MGIIDWLLRRGSSDPRRTTTFAFRRKLERWLLLNGESLRTARQFLEQNLDLLRPESEQLLAILIRGLPKKILGESFIEIAQGSQTILHKAIAGGKTPQAVRDAYIDEYTALRVLDLPPWLVSMNNRITFLAVLLSKGENTNVAAYFNPEADLKSLLPDTIARVRYDSSLEPEILASLQMFLGVSMLDDISPAASIELFIEAARIFGPRRFPATFAKLREYLGRSYFQQMQLTGDDENDDKLYAIVCLEDALRYCQPEKDLEKWDQLMRCLCSCYIFLGDYHQARQIRNAILLKLSSLASSAYLQDAQVALGNIEEFLQEKEVFMEMIELSTPMAGEMMREHFAREVQEKHADLERVRAYFAQLCTND